MLFCAAKSSQSKSRPFFSSNVFFIVTVGDSFIWCSDILPIYCFLFFYNAGKMQIYNFWMCFASIWCQMFESNVFYVVVWMMNTRRSFGFWAMPNVAVLQYYTCGSSIPRVVLRHGLCGFIMRADIIWIIKITICWTTVCNYFSIKFKCWAMTLQKPNVFCDRFQILCPNPHCPSFRWPINLKRLLFHLFEVHLKRIYQSHRQLMVSIFQHI